MSFTAASAEASNLLTTPSTALKPGGLYALLFTAGIGPIFADEDVFDALEANGDISSLPPIAKDGGVWGLAVRIKEPPQHGTVQAAFMDWTNGIVPAFAEASLTLVAVLPIGAPEDIGDVTLAVSQSKVLNPSVLGTIEDKVTTVAQQVGAGVSAGVKDLILVLVLVLLIVLAVKVLPHFVSK